MDSIRALDAGYGPDVLGMRLTVLEGIGFAGSTTSPDLPIRNAAQSAFGGDSDGFAGMWNPAAGTASWLTYLGGSGPDGAAAVAQNWAGDLYVGGWTRSADLPVTAALQPASAGGEDGMFAVLGEGGVLHHLSYYGGSGDDRVRAVVVMSDGPVRLAGGTTSADLPERSPSQSRGQMSEGFVAEIGTDHFAGPASLILAKDGMLPFAIRPGRSAFRLPVTWRSADPARVRFVYLGRSADEVTVPAGEDISVEGLSDDGSVEITATAEGFIPKTIRVNLYPGAFVRSSPGATVSTWSPEVFLFARYRAIDPATGQPIGTFLSLRNGIDPPAINWSVSDPSVFEIVASGPDLQLRVLRPGHARVSVNVEGFRVLEEDENLIAEAPRLTVSNEFRLGRELQARLPIYFTFNGVSVSAGHRGTLTARSEDPSRLLLALEPGHLGKPSVTLSMPDRPGPVIWAQALSGDGETRIIFTSSEFEGEIPMTVTLERTVVRWEDTSISMGVGALRGVAVFLVGESGSGSGRLRPGAPRLTATLANSNPRVVELNRLTKNMAADREFFQLRGLSQGVAELSLSVSPDWARLENSTLTVEVGPGAPLQVPAAAFVGKGLQHEIRFRDWRGGPVIVTSGDPAALLVSPLANVRGSAELTVSPAAGDYIFFLQALAGQGEVSVRLRAQGGVEQEIKTTLMQSGVAFSAPRFSPGSGFDRIVTVSAWAVDEASGVAILSQIPQPDAPVEVRLRTEGGTIRLSHTSLTLNSRSPRADVNFTLPPPGAQATLIAEAGANTIPALSGRLKIEAGSGAPGIRVIGSAMLVLARDEIRELSIQADASASRIIVTSGDPERVLVSTNSTAPGSASLDIPLPGSALAFFPIYVHALGDSGTVPVRVESPGQTPLELTVVLTPLRLTLSAPVLAVGQTVNGLATLNAPRFRPGVTPPRFAIRIADPNVASVRPETLVFGGSAAPISISGIAPGRTRLLVEGPPDVDVVSDPITVLAERPPSPIQAYTLGKNLQGGIRLDLDHVFSDPAGAPVTITSSDPGRVLLSRSPSEPGSESITVLAPAGGTQTELFYAQALQSEGEAILRASFDGATRDTAKIRLAPSWLGCTLRNGIVRSGQSEDVTCSLQSAASSVVDSRFSDLKVRSGLEQNPVRIANSAPHLFAVFPETVSFAQGTVASVRLQAIAPGQGELRVEQPLGFGPAPDGSDTLPVRILEPALTGSCSGETVLGKDTQFTCVLNVPAGLTVTASSGDPNLLVSASPGTVGAATAAVSSTGINASFTIQALASYGTAEVVFSAPAYEEARLAVAMKQTEIALRAQFSNDSTIALRVGEIANLELVVRIRGGSMSMPRAGAGIFAGLEGTPGGIVSLEPARVLIDQRTVPLRIRGTAPGSAVVRITVPEGLVVSETPFTATVRP